MIHDLKSNVESFVRIYLNEKSFEVRKNDRNFEKGDILRLREWDKDKKDYTGRELSVTVNYIQHGNLLGIEEGYCVLGLGTKMY